MAYLSVAVEGVADAALAERLCAIAGHSVIGSPYIANGKGRLDTKIAAYNKAAAYSPWFVLRDFDHDHPCPSGLREKLVPTQSAGMVLRIAVRTAEAWLMADRERLAAFLSVRIQKIPTDRRR
jgi:hypothetical protein